VDDVLAPLLGPLGYAFAAAWGAIWGSFFGLCVARIPEHESILRPRSHCRSCAAAIPWFHNLPILSWLWLRGRCAACGAAVSARYLVVELLSVALSLLIYAWIMDGLSGPMWFRLLAYGVHFFFAGTLLVLSLIDLATFLLPNVITYPAIPLFAIAAVLLGRPWKDVAIGLAIGYVFIRLLADGYYWITKREGMGYGDAKLLALIGGFLGWQALVPTLFLAALQGSVIGIAYGIAQKRAGKAESIRRVPIPFGPFLSLAALQGMLFSGWVRLLFPLA